MIGYVAFDNPEAMGHGWAARAGDRRARLIGGLHDLSSDTVWILSSEWNDLHAQQVHHHALYRHCRYFGPALPRVLADLGVPADAAQDQALVGAEVCARILKLYARVFADREDIVPPNRLISAVRERMSPADLPVPAELDQVLMDSSEMFDWVRDVSGAPNEGEEVVLRLHPVNYAQTLLASIIPDDSQPPVWDDHPPERPTLDWVVEHAPLVARITIDSQDRMVSALINYGATGNSGSQRRFVTHYELSRLLSSQIDLRVHQVIRWNSDPDRFAAIREVLAVIGSEEQGAFCASESVSLFAEILWRAAAAQMPPANARRKGMVRYRNLAAPFIHAYGRIACANAALPLINDGFLVRRQGYGQIALSMREGDDWRALADHCVRGAMLPPVFRDAHAINDYEPPKGFDPTNPFTAAVVLRVRGLRDDLFALDGALAGWAARKIA